MPPIYIYFQYLLLYKYRNTIKYKYRSSYVFRNKIIENIETEPSFLRAYVTFISKYHQGAK